MYTLLCLGDSYTVGEGVPLYENFPYQTVRLLRAAGKAFHAPEIVARTGWTTDELAAQLADSRLLNGYDFVSLLIGVNNQYRGRDSAEYAVQFEQLLRSAIGLVKQPGRPGTSAGLPGIFDSDAGAIRAFVLSIPDWSVTPFAAASGRDREKTAAAIDQYNALAKAITGRLGAHFIDITGHTRSSARSADAADVSGAASPPSPFAADGLHPSGTEYEAWAQALAQSISKYC
jgi:lysophospholipase L1-like esterase